MTKAGRAAGWDRRDETIDGKSHFRVVLDTHKSWLWDGMVCLARRTPIPERKKRWISMPLFCIFFWCVRERERERRGVLFNHARGGERVRLPVMQNCLLALDYSQWPPMLDA